ncbi:MAG: hypothetical protein U0694_16020 [Anaerolineae bacterium]
MDNGSPWGTYNQLPSALSLWLVGLAIQPIYGRPGCSTDNAIVERDHGVLAQWVEPHECTDFEMCEGRLNWAAFTQRERYRSPQGYTRRQAYPQLEENTRRYQPDQDETQWCRGRVIQYLAQFHFRRKVEINGRVTLFANSYSLGVAHARQYIHITFDPTTNEWVFTDDYQRLLRRHKTKEITYEQISQLRLAKRRRH